MNKKENLNISVIVPVYGVEKYLDMCIRSLINQTYKQFEIILIDDGSLDNSGKICDTWAKRDSRIKVFHKENGGLSSARNRGIDEAIGEYISFVDADDYLDPRYLEVLYELCEEHRTDISMCEHLCVDKYVGCMPRIRANYEKKESKEILHDLCCVPYSTKYIIACSKLYRRGLFNEIRFPEGKNHEDEYVTYKLILNTSKISITNEYLYYYLKRKDSITGVESPKSMMDAIGAFEERAEYLHEMGYAEEYEGTLKTLDYLRKQYKHKKCECLDTRDLVADSSIVIVKNWEHESELNQRIVIYGAGEVGKKLLCQLKKRKYQSIQIVDNRWHVPSLRKEGVEPIYKLRDYKIDTLIIALKNEQMQNQIISMLTDWGINESIIKCVSYN